MKIQKIKIRGHSRRIYALIFVAIFAIAGTGYLLYSRAATGVLGIYDSGVAMKANTSPSLNGDILAFNDRAFSEMRFRYYSPTYGGNQAYGTAVRPVLPILDGTNPSVSGIFISYQSNLGTLQYYNWTTGKNVDTTQIVKAGTSPAMFGDNIAYISTSGTLRYYNTTTSKMVDTNQPVLPGTNPAISGDIIAFQSVGTTLTFWKISTGQLINTNQGMRAGTSPSISGDTAAFQANTTALYYWKISTSQSINTNQGMMSGTNPSVSGNTIAFQANTSTLYYWNIPSSTTNNTGLYMSTTTSPSIFGNIIAYQGSNTNLIYYTIPNVPPPPTVTLTGPSSVNQGQGATLTYKTSNTNSCTISGFTFDPTQSIDGAYYVNLLNATTTYTITCTGTGGVVVSASWTVQAVGPPSGGITGPASVVAGQQPSLTISTANVVNCTVNGVSVAANGPYVAPEITDYATYELKCGGADGSGTALIASTAVSVVPINYGGQKGNPLDGSMPTSTDTTASAASSNKPKYYYVSPFGILADNVIGMSSDITTGNPKVGGRTIGSHSLGQIGVHNEKDGNFNTINGVEFGWIVGGINSDSKPRIFVYNVRNGYNVYDTSHGCYNFGCGFVSTSTVKPSKTLTIGSTHNYRITYSSASDRWNLYFDDKPIGYYPASLFLKSSGRIFHSGTMAHPWGEVHDAGGQCVEMGNGIRGSYKGSTRIDNFKVQYTSGWESGILSTPQVTYSQFYNAGSRSDIGLNFGGPGRTTC